MYLDSTKFDDFVVVRSRPAIRDWTSHLMKKRQELELQHEVLGRLELHAEWTEEEFQNTEGFICEASNDSISKEVCVSFKVL